MDIYSPKPEDFVDDEKFINSLTPPITSEEVDKSFRAFIVPETESKIEFRYFLLGHIKRQREF
ncbi:hypothetical protein ACFL7D_02450 [candidate division KSB1 bacterium]